MNPALRNFYANENERETVKAFLIEVLKEMAVEMAFEGESVTGIREARLLITKAFDKLEEVYGKVEEPIIHNSR